MDHTSLPVIHNSGFTVGEEAQDDEILILSRSWSCDILGVSLEDVALPIESKHGMPRVEAGVARAGG